MKTLSRTQSLAAAALAAVTFGLPAAANAGNYSQSGNSYVDCKKSDQENQLVGGLLGAVAGGVFGSQVAGHGSRTEGSVLGAVVGAAAGAGIGDTKRKCRQEAGMVTSHSYGSTYSAPVTYSSGTTYGTTHTAPRTYGSTTTYSQPRSYGTTTTYTQPRTYGTTTTYTQPRTYGTTTTYRPATTYVQPVSHSSSYRSRGDNRVNNIKFRIDNLRAELDLLQSRQRHHYSHRRANRIASLGAELRQLKNRKRVVKKRINKAPTYYRHH